MILVTLNKLIKMYRYILEPYTGKNSRHTCPNCGKPHEFSRYIDTETGEMLAEHVGKCNRLDKCGYHYTPKMYFAENGIKPVYNPKPVHRPVPNRDALKTSFIPKEIVQKSLTQHDDNNFIKYLDSVFDFYTIDLLIGLYSIGTSARYGGGTTVFWQIDINDNVRTGKLIKYDSSGHRIHGKNNWAHSVLNLDNFNLKQCLFGEHLLKHAPDAVVCLVESEKTAVIAQGILSDFLWLATGGAENLNKEKIEVLKGRKVVLYPDASKDGRIYDKWKKKADEFGFYISDILEKETTPEQKANGVDIADFLVAKNQTSTQNKDLPSATVEAESTDFEEEDLQFESEEEEKEIMQELLEEIEPLTRKSLAIRNWDNEISQLENFFDSVALPERKISLNDWTVISDPKKFVASSMATIKQNNGNSTFYPYLERLKQLQAILSGNDNSA